MIDQSALLNWVQETISQERERRGRTRNISEMILDAGLYRDCGVIGRGVFGSVHRYEDMESGKSVAVKCYNVGELSSDEIQGMFVSEVGILALLNHRCILRVKGCFLPTHDRPNPMIVLDKMSCSLATVIYEREGVEWWDWTSKSIVVAGIALGMRYLHKKEVIHRDLKPSNILLDEDHLPCIGDFGTSRLENANITKTAGVGTPRYMAPECYGDHYDNKCDVYSFGLILYEIVTGEEIFAGLNPYQVMGRATQGVRPDIPNSVHPRVKDLIKACWAVDPSSRPSFADIISRLEDIDYCIGYPCDQSRIHSFIRWATFE